MTPSGWTMNTLVGWGAAWMFGGAMLSALLGFLIGRKGDSTRGIGSALFLWGAGNLLVALSVWVFVQFDTTVLTLTATRCEPLRSDTQPVHQLYYAVKQAGRPTLEATVGLRDGLCPESPMPTDSLRLRKDALAGPATVLRAEWADDTPLAVVVSWSAFGIFAVFAGGLLLSHSGPVSSKPSKPEGPLPPWRAGLGRLLGQLGLLLVLAAFIGPHWLSGSTERSIAFGLRTGATAMGCWIVAGLLARTMGAPVVSFLLLFVLALLGVAELLMLG